MSLSRRKLKITTAAILAKLSTVVGESYGLQDPEGRGYILEANGNQKEVNFVELSQMKRHGLVRDDSIASHQRGTFVGSYQCDHRNGAVYQNSSLSLNQFGLQLTSMLSDLQGRCNGKDILHSSCHFACNGTIDIMHTCLLSNQTV